MIVQRVTSNSALVCGVFVPRPAHMPSTDWREFWEPNGVETQIGDSIPGRCKTLINFDAFRAMVFGAVIPKPATITQQEWEMFWQPRSDRQPLSDTNYVAEDAAYRARGPRTARKPRKR